MSHSDASRLSFRSVEDARSKKAELDDLLAHPDDPHMDEDTVKMLKDYRQQCGAFLVANDESF
jgi:hypothetical protein